LFVHVSVMLKPLEATSSCVGAVGTIDPPVDVLASFEYGELPPVPFARIRYKYVVLMVTALSAYVVTFGPAWTIAAYEPEAPVRRSTVNPLSFEELSFQNNST
jgi:hypothetical protein